MVRRYSLAYAFVALLGLQLGGGGSAEDDSSASDNDAAGPGPSEDEGGQTTGAQSSAEHPSRTSNLPSTGPLKG